MAHAQAVPGLLLAVVRGGAGQAHRYGGRPEHPGREGVPGQDEADVGYDRADAGRGVPDGVVADAVHARDSGEGAEGNEQEVHAHGADRVDAEAGATMARGEVGVCQGSSEWGLLVR